ncbi:hypothetical protein C8J57DRAFT_1491354 [Mycena rebaudengoi]|nr:hypothetical protein C8J57DRAFT_1491354 [Mycena rebaudengoi]
MPIVAVGSEGEVEPAAVSAGSPSPAIPAASTSQLLRRASVEEVLDEGDQPPSLLRTTYTTLATSQSTSLPNADETRDHASSPSSHGAHEEPLCSEAPSLASLIPRDLDSTQSISQALGVRWNDTSLEERVIGQHPHLFLHSLALAMFNIFHEPLHNSVQCYHALFDPITDYDPLIHFSAVDGKLPHRSMEESIALRDVLICWTAPHMELQWENLPQGIRDVVSA